MTLKLEKLSNLNYSAKNKPYNLEKLQKETKTSY